MGDGVIAIRLIRSVEPAAIAGGTRRRFFGGELVEA